MVRIKRNSRPRRPAIGAFVVPVLSGLLLAVAIQTPAAAHADPAHADPAPGELTGRWAQIQVISAIENVPVLGEIVNRMGVLLLLDIRQEGKALRATETVCHMWMSSSSDQLDIVFPPGFSRALSGAERTGSIQGSGEDAAFQLDRLRIIKGVKLSDPVREALPEEPDDPRVTDEDGDGKPGLTVRSEGLVSGNIYLVQRSWNRLVGAVRKNGSISGRIEWGSERRVVEADSFLLKLDPDSRPHPDPEKSAFRMVRVDEKMTCSELASQSRDLFK